MARRGLHPRPLPRRGRPLNDPSPTVATFTAAGGKVLDASALDAWARGHLGMSTWYALAWELQVTFLVPAGARAEALLLRPDAADLVDVLLAAPYVLTAAPPDEPTRRQLLDLQEQARVYDPHTALAVHLARTRGWPVLTTDPDRLRRLTPDLEINAL